MQQFVMDVPFIIVLININRFFIVQLGRCITLYWPGAHNPAMGTWPVNHGVVVPTRRAYLHTTVQILLMRFFSEYRDDKKCCN